jgi:hypothetical protein
MRIARVIFSFIFFLVAVAVIGLVFLFRTEGVADLSPFQPGEAAHQIAALRDKLGYPPQGVSVELEPSGMTIEVQSRENRLVSDQWTVRHIYALGGLVDFTYVGGPDPVPAGPAGLSIEQRSFDLAQVDFATVSKLADAAIERVGLQEPGAVTNMTLAKQHILIPVEQAGPLHWTISVASAHESAEAYADPAGKLTGANLDGTLRAQLLDLFQGGRPLLDITKAIADRFDGKEQMEKLIVYNKYIDCTLLSAGPGERPGRYSSGLNGVYRDAISDMTPMHSFTEPDFVPKQQPFAMRDVDWAAMPDLVAKARDILGMPDAKVELLEIDKKAAGAFEAPAIEWRFELQLPSGKSDAILLDTSGRELRPPPGRQAGSRNLLEPAAITRLLDTLRQKVDPRAAVMEIRLEPDRAWIDLRDPRKPDRITALNYEGGAVDLAPPLGDRPGKWHGMAYDDDWLFDLSALDAPFLQALPEREAAALQHLRIPGGKVTGLILGHQRLMFDNSRQLVVMVEVSGDDHADGRVFFDPRGKILRSDGP